MGSKEACKYYCLIVFFIFFSCSTKIKSLDEKNLSGKIIRVEVNNNSYEAGITHIFKGIIENDIIKRGGEVTEIGENIKIYVNIIDIKTTPVTFDKKDFANSYNLIVKSDIKIYDVGGQKEKLIKGFSLSPIYSYSIKGLTDSEIERQLSIEKAVFEISSVIISNLIALP